MKKQRPPLKKTLKEYWTLVKEYKLSILIIICIATILEATTLIPKYLLKEIIDSSTKFSNNTINQIELLQYFKILLIIFIGFILIQIVLRYARQTLLMKLDANIVYKIKKKYFGHLLSLDYGFHISHKTGKIISRMNRGSSAIEGLNDAIIFNITPLFVQGTIIAITFAYFSIETALVLIAISILFIYATLQLQKALRKEKQKYNDTQDSERGYMADYFTNIETIKSFGMEAFIKNKFNKLITLTKKKSLDFWKWYRRIEVTQSSIINIGTILIIYFPLRNFVNGTITIGTVSFIYATYLGYVGILYQFTYAIRGIYQNTTDLESLTKYSEYSNRIKDKENAPNIKVRKGKIEFKNISFTYPKGEHVFNNFNLNIPAGKKIALVGHSGSGKTSIIKLLYRLYDPQKGKITIDGIDIKEVNQESLRNEMAIVSQDPILFDDTIYNNIKFSNPKASKEEVQKAIQFAQLDKVIAKLPKKANTIVGERGVKLSGGQKQRVSIARALLANKKILVLDEATSALDSETESEIQKDLQELMKNRTAIIIAHRLSTIMHADEIIVMNEGNIIQRGNHKELIKQGGEYKKLWNLQKGGFLQD